MIAPEICLAIEDEEVAERVDAILSGFGYRTLDCGCSTCPAHANAIVTDRPWTARCRRETGCAQSTQGDAPALECEIPLVRLAMASRPPESDTAFATLPESFAEERLLIAVARAVRYREHLATMRTVRRPARP